ncbi:MAG: DoxX family protein [Nitrospinales bacterium]
MFSELAKIILRAAVGIVFVYHGAQKLFGAFGGSGMEAFAKYLQSLGVPYPQVGAYLSGGAEFFCGLALILGLLARWATLPLLVDMAVAIVTVHGSHGFNIVHKGYEYNMVLIAALLSILLTGSGKYSLKN